MYRSFLSWRYLVSRFTNLIGIAGILVAVGALILILSIMTGFLEESRKTLRGTLSDLIITPIQGERSSRGIVPRDPAPLLAAVTADARVAAAAPQLLYGAMITQRERGRHFERLLSAADPTHSGMLVVQLVGIDVDGIGRFVHSALCAALVWTGGAAFPWSSHDELDSSAFLHSLIGDPAERELGSWTAAPVNPLFPFLLPERRGPGRPKAGILVGEQLYDQLALHAGEELEIGTVVREPDSGEWRQNNRHFVIAGTFRTRENETDTGRIYLDRRELADFLGGTHDFTHVLVRMRDYERDSAALTADLREQLSEAGLIAGGELYGRGLAEVRTWEELRGNLLGAIRNERALMGIMLSLVLLLAGFLIFAILSMMVTEKRRDIGILTALGATPRGVLQLFLMIAFWDALLGGVLGGVIGTWAALKIDPLERWLSSTFGFQIFDRRVYLFDHIPSVVQPLWVATIVLGAFLCALVFAALPAWRAARLDPLTALRHE